MIYELKRLDGYVYAYISWVTVTPTELGDVINDEGSHVQVMGTWIHPDYRRHNVLSNLIDGVFNHKTTANAEFVFWYREGKDRNSGILKKQKFSRYIKEN